MHHTIVALHSQNSKLTDGNIGVAATYRPVGYSCPSDCAMLGAGCYAQKGFTGIQQWNSKRFNSDLEKVGLSAIKFLRLNVSGDFFLKNRLDKPYFAAVVSFAKQFPSVLSWGYSHRFTAFGKRKPKMPKNLNILASVDSLSEAKQAQKAGWRTARVVDNWNETVKGEVRCPNQLNKNIVCVKCGLCWHPNKKIKGIAFLRH